MTVPNDFALEIENTHTHALSCLITLNHPESTFITASCPLSRSLSTWLIWMIWMCWTPGAFRFQDPLLLQLFLSAWVAAYLGLWEVGQTSPVCFREGGLHQVRVWQETRHLQGSLDCWQQLLSICDQVWMDPAATATPPSLPEHHSGFQSELQSACQEKGTASAISSKHLHPATAAWFPEEWLQDTLLTSIKDQAIPLQNNIFQIGAYLWPEPNQIICASEL